MLNLKFRGRKHLISSTYRKRYLVLHFMLTIWDYVG